MTTAARPTWAPAKGGEDQGGARKFGGSRQVSAKDIASHTILKDRCDRLKYYYDRLGSSPSGYAHRGCSTNAEFPQQAVALSLLSL
jgi:hypothetical protein